MFLYLQKAEVNDFARSHYYKFKMSEIDSSAAGNHPNRNKMDVVCVIDLVC